MILAAEPASSEASSRGTGDGSGPGVLSGHCQVARRFGVVRHQQHTPQPAVAASCERRRRKVRAGPVCEVSASARAALTGSTITRDGRAAFPDGSPAAAPRRAELLKQLAGVKT